MELTTCADCAKKGCRESNLDDMPKNCPTPGTDKEYWLGLYSPEERKIAAEAARIEALGYRYHWTRLEETMEYARRMGYKHLGIAFCAGFSNEALALARILRANGFKVSSVCCKVGSVGKSNLGLARDEQVRLERPDEAMCNPVGQAEVLNNCGCDFCLIMGLCVGHDTAFIAHCKSPVTAFACKDHATVHNPLAPLHSPEYFRKINSFLDDYAHLWEGGEAKDG
jgi:uncharacterized metal-binding protein